MIRMTALKLLMLLCLTLGITVRIEEGRVSAEQSRAATAALAVTNLAAERDSTRNVARTNKRVAALLGDSLQLVEKHAVQVAQRGDALDRALGRERRARYALDASVDSLHRAASTPVAVNHDDGIRMARFDIREPPYTVQADVSMPPPPDSAHIALRVSIDAIPIEARVSCSPANEDGIRTATVTASSPPWAKVRFGHVEQSPELCTSPALVRSRTPRRLVRFTPLVIGGGRVVATDGSSRWGLFVGAGVRIGH
ncbi:MAG: hypothetical protein JWM41_4996 [Gemmatimonadetes bacterium]|nr:hypothetical protein [Gemmatimonadota bacterium]